MTLLELLAIANENYPDNFLSEYYHPETGELITGGTGDTLAEFIVIEIVETYDEDASDQEQLAVALRCMTNAAEEISAVVKSLSRRLTP